MVTISFPRRHGDICSNFLERDKHAISTSDRGYSMPVRRLVRVEGFDHVIGFREIQLEYISWLDLMLNREHGISLTADSTDQLMAEITSNWPLYSGCLGSFFLAYIGENVGGMAGIKYVSKEICELKRLYVSPHYRRVGIGSSLVERLLIVARKLGYSWVRLETLDFMEAAIRLYESYGFVRAPEYEGTEGRGYGIHDHEIYFSKGL
jgi:putative acetyltransferase